MDDGLVFPSRFESDVAHLLNAGAQQELRKITQILDKPKILASLVEFCFEQQQRPEEEQGGGGGGGEDGEAVNDVQEMDYHKNILKLCMRDDIARSLGIYSYKLDPNDNITILIQWIDPRKGKV